MSDGPSQVALVYNESGSSEFVERIATDFKAQLAQSKEDVFSGNADVSVIVIDMSLSESEPCVDLIRSIKDAPDFEDIPIIVYSKLDSKLDTMALFDAGASDLVDDGMSTPDLVARLNKAVFHTIANRQLKSRLKQANDMAFSAMSDTSDLGVNVQFLIHCHDCSNIDELGMLLFSTLAHYQVHCSLQIRSRFETKNMEENGLAKDLEGRLLWELKDNGRYVDFGKRCVMNYGQVSLLVKNMPEDEKRYGTLKDNIFPLLQGADARVKSIDTLGMLEMERDIMRGMSAKMQGVMHQVDERYQTVMRQCADLVEDMALKVDESILFLDLTEEQENTFSKIMQEGVKTISELFNQGVRIDESFRKLVDYLHRTLKSGEEASVEEMQAVLEKL